MGKTCAVRNCENVQGKCIDKSFFTFPKDEFRRKQWCESLAIDVAGITVHKIICSDHFADHDIDRTRKKVQVKHHAIPVITKTKNNESTSVSVSQPSSVSQPLVRRPFQEKNCGPTTSNANLSARMPASKIKVNVGTGIEQNTSQDSPNTDGLVTSLNINSVDNPKRRKTVGRHFCVVRDCKNAQEISPSKSFFKFPKDERMRREWCQNVGIDFARTTQRSVVCSDHFDVRILIKPELSKTTRLPRYAVPLSHARPTSTASPQTHTQNGAGSHDSRVINDLKRNVKTLRQKYRRLKDKVKRQKIIPPEKLDTILDTL